ncbi:mitochondrial pyruvate carrier 1-like isoform X1 [Elaeis guineensis]|uniref:mitochondrial pyruvate carrier 1-like isoform X1 n=1 Tax=Elaeis guineensis var. tenera TaxID=51953 RepID=UPI003C6D4B8B
MLLKIVTGKWTPSPPRPDRLVGLAPLPLPLALPISHTPIRLSDLVSGAGALQSSNPGFFVRFFSSPATRSRAYLIVASLSNVLLGYSVFKLFGTVNTFGHWDMGLVDTQKPPEMISGNMTAVMCVYSGLFMRFAWMVQPRNYLLLACHTSNESVQLYQLSRWAKAQGYWDKKETELQK